MDYLTDHSGKLINSTEAITHMYNLLKEEVSNYFSIVINRLKYINLNFYHTIISRLRKI